MSWFRGFEEIACERQPLARRTSYKVGGPAQYFAEPPDTNALGQLLRRAAREAIPVHILGQGSNVLVADEGVPGLVVRLPEERFSYRRLPAGTNAGPTPAVRIFVGAAHSIPSLVKWSILEGLAGLECLAGVPGTVGAALRMNAGGKHGEIGACVRAVHGFERDGTPFALDAGQCCFAYRRSALEVRVVTECELELAESDPTACKVLARSILLEKRATQPLDARSAGCVFKNPRLPGVPTAGKLIDELGLKGLRIGGAAVSTLHANFLICEDHASARDLAELIRTIRQRALAERGVKLELEVEAWGFEAEELLPQAWTNAA